MQNLQNWFSSYLPKKDNIPPTNDTRLSRSAVCCEQPLSGQRDSKSSFPDVCVWWGSGWVGGQMLGWDLHKGHVPAMDLGH